LNKKRFLASSLLVFGLTTMYLRSSLAKVNISKQKQINVDGVKDVQLNVASADIEIVPYDSENMVISLAGKENKCIQDNVTLQVKEQAGKVNINYKIGHPILSIIDGSKYETKMRVEIPHGKVDALQVHASSGDISVKDILCSEISTHSTSGDQRFIKTHASKGLNASAGSGDIVVENIESNKATFQTNSGDVTFNVEQLKMDLAFTTTSGDVVAKFGQIPSSMKVDFKGKSGQAFLQIDDLIFEEESKHRLLATKGAGDNEIKVRSKTGDFSLSV